MIWRNIPGWDDYEASDSGSIRRVSTGCVLRARIRASHDGYAVVDLQAPSRASSRKKVTIGVHILVWYETHSDIRDAIAREKQIKGWNRAWKSRLIEKHNSGWNDLYGHLAG